MPWTEEQKKEYNKQYYSNNKIDLIERGCKKIKCDECGREITKNNFLKHKTTKLCKNTKQRNANIEKQSSE